MRNTTLIVLLFLVLTPPFTKLHAQTQITSCSSQFSDKGGFDSNYLNNENSDWLICPDDSTQFLVVTFTHVNIEVANNQGVDSTGCYDVLYIYDGMDNSAPLMGSFCGEESGTGENSFVEGHTLKIGDTFKPTNSDGCFYFRFESDQSKNLSGWHAEVTCCTPSLENGMTDGIDVPYQTNNGEIISLEIDNSCTRNGNLSLFTEFEPSGNSCYTKGLTYENQSFYAFKSNPFGGFVELAIDSIDSVGIMEMVVYGPVVIDSVGNYTGGVINDCVTGEDPWSLFFNAGPDQLYILGVASELSGRISVTTLPTTIGLGGVLPVKLLDYRLETKEETVQLEWSTSQEINNDRFEIYRSYDGKTFEMIGTEKAGANPQIINHYTHSDQPKSNGHIYYYVKQIDLNGTTTDFKILRATFNHRNVDFASYPNPSEGGAFSIQIDKKILESSDATIQLYNQMGKLVVERRLNGETNFDFQDISSGMYTIRIIAGSSIITHQHLIH